MATKNVTAKKRVAKKVAAKRPDVKKTAAKQISPQTIIGASAAAVGGTGFPMGIGSIVMFTSDGTAVGPGRLCALHGIGNACVMFGDGIGCQRVAADLLSVAPAGSTAPSCDGCDDC